MMLLSSSLTRLSIVVSFLVFQRGNEVICVADEISNSKTLQGAVDLDNAHGRELVEDGASTPTQTPVSNPASIFWGAFLDPTDNKVSTDSDNHNNDHGEHKVPIPPPTFQPPPTFVKPIVNPGSPPTNPSYPADSPPTNPSYPEVVSYYETPYPTPYRKFVL